MSKEEFTNYAKKMVSENRYKELMEKHKSSGLLKMAYNEFLSSIATIIFLPFGLVLFLSISGVCVVIDGLCFVIDIAVDIVLLAGMSIEALLNLIFQHKDFKCVSSLYAKKTALKENFFSNKKYYLVIL